MGADMWKAALCIILLRVGLHAQATPGAGPAGETKPEDLGAIEGQVVVSRTGAPVKKAQVSASSLRQTYAAETGVDGRFSILGMEPGSYRVGVQKSGFIPSSYGATRVGARGKTISLGKAQHLSDIDVQLFQHGIVMGKVVDTDDEPMEGIGIHIIQKVFRNGQAQWMPAESGTTNDLGEYRIAGLLPGKYFLQATGPATERGFGHMTGAAAELWYAPVFYPGVVEASAAMAVEVASGSEVRSINFKLKKTKVGAIKGRLGGMYAADSQIVLRARNESAFVDLSTSVGRDNRTFEFQAVPPGSYLLYATGTEYNRPMEAKMPVEVSGGKVQVVELVLYSLSNFAGVLIAEGDSSALSQVAVGISQVGRPLQIGSQDGSHRERVNSALRFVMKQVQPEVYRLRCSGLPNGFYVKSVTVGDQGYLPDHVDLSRGGGDLRVILGQDGGSATGEVRSERDEKPASDAAVVLVPALERRGEPSLFLSATTDDTGHYAIGGIPPGTYRLFAFESGGPEAWADPELLSRVESRGEEVVVQPNGRVSKSLKSIPDLE